MGFLDFLRKKKKELEEETVVPTNLELSELDKFLSDKKSELKENNQKFHNSIKNHIESLITNLNSNIKSLNEIDWTKKKAEKRVLLIVKDNLNNYISYIKRLISELEDLNEENPISLLEKTNSIFQKFDKQSAMNYQKATFLIGKEMEEVRNSVSVYLKATKLEKENNKQLITNLQTLSFVNKKFSELSEIENLIDKTNKNIDTTNDNIEILNKSISNSNLDISNIKNSDKYKSYEQNIENLHAIQKQIDSQIFLLKQKIEFKKLATTFHKVESKMEIVKSYRENFKSKVLKDSGAELAQLLIDSQLTNPQIETMINTIASKLKEKSLIPNEKSPILDLESKIEKSSRDISDLKENMHKDQKKLEKFSLSKKSNLDSMKKELEKLNITLKI